MSRRLLSDRVISIVPVTAGENDARGNETKVEGDPIDNVRAGRRQLEANEDIVNRDEQERGYLYVIEPYSDDGTVVTITGRDRIVDGDDTLEVRGTPELHTRRARPHHIEAQAYLVEG